MWLENCTEAIKIIRRLQRAEWLRQQVAMVCAGDAKEYTAMLQPPAGDQTDAGTYTLNTESRE